jgi:hypothetical protein
MFESRPTKEERADKFEEALEVFFANDQVENVTDESVMDNIQDEINWLARCTINTETLPEVKIQAEADSQIAYAKELEHQINTMLDDNEFEAQKAEGE